MQSHKLISYLFVSTTLDGVSIEYGFKFHPSEMFSLVSLGSGSKYLGEILKQFK